MPAPAAEAPRSAAVAPTPPPPALVQAMKDLRTRTKCNRIMGCPASSTLLGAGRAATPLILEALGRRGGSDAPWITMSIELLGQLGDEGAVPLLTELLGDPRWEVRARSAQALGRLGRVEARSAVSEALSRVRAAERLDVASLGALLFADDRLATAAGEASREATDVRQAELLRQLDGGPAELGPLNPGVYALVLEIVRDWRLAAALPAARLGATHSGRFVKLEALKTMAALQDTGGIPPAMGLLDDPSPGIRRQAIATLQAITGARSLADADAWRAWCDQRRCLEAR